MPLKNDCIEIGPGGDKVENRKLVCYIAESLDGYIATEDDSLEWLFKVEGEGDAGYSEFIETIDTVIMGRRTYEWIMEMEQGRNPYVGMDCYIFSRTLPAGQASEDITVIDEEISVFVEQLKKTPGKNIWVVGGSDLLDSFMEHGLIDEFILTIAPVTIGKGIPLFQKSSLTIEYRLKNVKQFGEFAQLHYKLK